MAYTITEKAIRFRHPDYNPDRAQKLNQFVHVPTSVDTQHKSMHALLSNLANRQTDKRGQKHLSPPLSEVMTDILT